MESCDQYTDTRVICEHFFLVPDLHLEIGVEWIICVSELKHACGGIDELNKMVSSIPTDSMWENFRLHEINYMKLFAR